MGAIQSPYLALGLPTGPAGGDLSGSFPNPTVTGSHLATVQTATVNITGTVAETIALAGPTIASGGNYAGLCYDFAGAGVVTTTVDTQTVSVNLRLGGVGGALLISMNINPDSSATITGAEFSFEGYVEFNTATSVSCKVQVDSNYFPSSVNQNTGVVVSNTAAQQLALTLTPSATAEIYAVNSGFWRKAN